MDSYGKLRLACAKVMNQREAALHFGKLRDSVRTILGFAIHPSYRRSAPIRRPKLDGVVEQHAK